MQIICCLPNAGPVNPYQRLMMDGLERVDGLTARYGADGKVFPFSRTALKNRPDYIHLDWIHSYQYRRSSILTVLQTLLFVVDVFLITTFTSTKLIWTVHNLTPHDTTSSKLILWSRRYFAKCCKRLRVFSTLSVERTADVLDVSTDKISVTPEGNYSTVYENQISRTEAREYLNLGDEAFVLLFFGTIRPYKGLEELIAAYRSARANNTVLVIAGMPLDQEYSKNIAELVKIDKDILFFPRMIDPDEVQYYMNSADLVALPFANVENSGSTILAMGFAKPIVAPAIGVLPDRLSQQQQLLYDQSFTQALGTILQTQDLTLLNGLGEKNRTAADALKWEQFGQVFMNDVAA